MINFSNSKTILIFVALIVVIGLLSYWMSNNVVESFNDMTNDAYVPGETAFYPRASELKSDLLEQANDGVVTGKEESSEYANVNNMDISVDEEGMGSGSGNVASAYDTCAPKDMFPQNQLNPSDLLPLNSEDSVWAQVNPDGQGELKDKNFLESGHHIGVNTVGQSRRNANYQIRSEPPNPQHKVSPWMNTTIEPDTNRRRLEVGSA